MTKRAASKAKNYGDDLNRVDEVSAHSDEVNSLEQGKVSNNQDDFSVYPSTPVGRRGDHIQVPPPANVNN